MSSTDPTYPVKVPGLAAARLARTILAGGALAPSKSDTTIERRQATVTAVNFSGGIAVSCDIQLAASGVTVPGVAFVASYAPVVNDTVWVDMKGYDPLIVASQSTGGWVSVGSGGSAPAFTNTWANFGSTFQVAQFRREASQIVRIRGEIAGGTINASAFTLPVGYRPPADLVFAQVDGANAIGRVDVLSGGTVVPKIGSNTSYSINCVFATD